MRHNYNFDTENLVFQKEHFSFRKHLIKILKYIATGIILGSIVFLISIFGSIESPEKIIIERQNAQLLTDIDSINQEFNKVVSFLSDIQDRDDNVYRVISKTHPLSASIRQAGFGGIDKYTNLQGYSNSDLLINLNKKSDILLNQLMVQNKSYDTVINLVLYKEDSLLSIPAIAPVAPHDYFRISSPFGYRVHPITGRVTMHDGIDFAANPGRPIHASGSGTVISVKHSREGYGNRIIIDHGFGFKSLYAHCSKIYVKAGDKIQRGQLIGLVGNTGSSTGPHLHYEVIKNNHKMNPKSFYINDLTQSEYRDMITSLSATK